MNFTADIGAEENENSKFTQRIEFIAKLLRLGHGLPKKKQEYLGTRLHQKNKNDAKADQSQLHLFLSYEFLELEG